MKPVARKTDPGSIKKTTLSLKLQFLEEAYPAPQGGWYELMTSLAFGLFIAFFLLFFEPFDLNILDYPNKELTNAFYGLITSGTMLIFLVILPKSFPSLFRERQWRVKHHILYFGLILLVIATLNGLYINYINNLQFNWANYGWILVRTYAIGAIPFSLLILVDYNRRLSFFLKQAQELDGQPTLTDMHQPLTLCLEGKHTLELEPHTFLYIQADGNYLHLVRQEGEELRQELFRASLKEVMQQIDQDYIQRCHRSYIVNIKKITKVTGNAQGLKLQVQGTDHIVPVSRKYLARIKACFEAGATSA